MSFRSSSAFKWYVLGGVFLSGAIAGIGSRYIPSDWRIVFSILVGLVVCFAILEIGERRYE